MPLFISFEGPDGSGKSTQARLLVEVLRARGQPVTETREPGGTPLGERIRHLLLDPESPAGTPLAAAFLLSAARTQLVTDVIRPALQRGEIVIADRFADSTLAYQASGHGLDPCIARDLARMATGGLTPDLTVYVDVEAEVGLARVAARGARNRLDAETLAFHQRVQSGYLQLIAEEPQRWIVVDGAFPVDSVHRTILAALEHYLAEVRSSV
jgi:dTMP kinase